MHVYSKELCPIISFYGLLIAVAYTNMLYFDIAYTNIELLILCLVHPMIHYILNFGVEYDLVHHIFYFASFTKSLQPKSDSLDGGELQI